MKDVDIHDREIGPLENGLTDQERAQLSLVRQARAARQQLEDRMEAIFLRAFAEVDPRILEAMEADADGDNEFAMAVLANIDRTSEDARTIVNAFVEWQIRDGIRQPVLEHGLQAVDPNGERWTRPGGPVGLEG